MIKGADISECGQYRYRLWRWWNDRLPMAIWIMLNPSTADADADDPTIRRCMGFTRRWADEGLFKCGGIMVVNLFAYRATKPADLRTVGCDVAMGEPHERPDPEMGIHTVNDVFLFTETKDAPLVVAAWGTQGWRWGRGPIVRNRMRTNGVQLHHLGLTRNDQPKHPLYLKNGTRPTLWDASEAKHRLSR